ncbi:MAG: hypothetical protein QNJ16_10650 [Rhodobacter sp.]|nr:hypothetical protein [Rhodobacter sp.]
MAYVTDGREDPGHVYQLDVTHGNREAVFANPKGHLSALALLDDVLYFLNANSQEIYRSVDGCQFQLLYTHSDYVRDLAFDSAGTLHFSAARGAAEDGTIFALDTASGVATAKYSVPLEATGGFWAGTFAFDPDDVLYVSSGNRIPASIYRYDDPGYTQVYQAQNPIMSFQFIASDTLVYADHGQELRRLENFTTDTAYARNPDTVWMNDVVFAPEQGFTQLPDWDGDGQGDACDCDDSYMGPNEDGADCGGDCGGSCPTCRPLLLTADQNKGINIVLVPDNDYGTNIAEFRDDIRKIVLDGFHNTPGFSDGVCGFNYYFVTQHGNYTPTCGGIMLPAAESSCPGGSRAVLFTAGGRACQMGNAFSILYAEDTDGSPNDDAVHTARHETGHAVFDLSDEYCVRGNCDGTYSYRPDPQANVYDTRDQCINESEHAENCDNFCPTEVCTDEVETHDQIMWMPAGVGATGTLIDCQTWAMAQGVNPGSCRQDSPTRICSPNWQTDWRIPGGGIGEPCDTDTSGDGWWKADRSPNALASCVMDRGQDFERDCADRIALLMNDKTFCPGTPASPGAPSSAQERGIKALVLYLHVEDGAFALRDAQLVYNFPQRTFLREARFSLELLGDGEPLFGMTFNDPRVMHVYATADAPPEKRFRAAADIRWILPFEPGIEEVRLTDRNTGEVVLTAPLTEAVEQFCGAFPDDRDCQ